MKLRFNTLWRVPVFCIVFSWISYYLTFYIGGFFFTAKTVGAGGITQVSADPLRSAIFNGLLFLIVLLLDSIAAPSAHLLTTGFAGGVVLSGMTVKGSLV